MQVLTFISAQRAGGGRGACGAVRPREPAAAQRDAQLAPPVPCGCSNVPNREFDEFESAAIAMERATFGLQVIFTALILTLTHGTGHIRAPGPYRA